MLSVVDVVTPHEGVPEPVLQRAFEYWCNVAKDLGERAEKRVRAGQC